MALYIQLIRKGETQPTPLNQIDLELCQLLGEEPDEHKYIHNWLDFIGMQLCIEGCELGSEALRDKVISWDIPELVTILKYLEENFTTNTWSK
jgi:hypothetical protein